MNNIYNPDMECLKRSELESLQLDRLKSLVDYCEKNVPFYNKRLSEAGVTADKIKTLSDIKYIPYTTKEDLRDTYPFGLFGVKPKELVRLHASSGTTGNPTVVGYTRADLDNWAEQVARIVVAAGATDESMVQICFGYGMFTGALGLHYGLERIGATVVPTSSGNTEKQLKFMRDFKSDAIVATPSYCLYLAEAAQELSDVHPMSEYFVKFGILGSESTTVAMRKRIEERWGGGLFTTDNYGISELNGPGISGECHLRQGLHICEDHFLCEIVDPKTLEVMDRGDTGEMVITNLTKRGLPMLRYRTKDITSINYDTCECGRTSARMVKLTGRSDDMIKVRGVNVFPTQLESTLIETPEVTAHYRLIVRSEKHFDSLEVQIELADEALLTKPLALEKIRSKLDKKVHDTLGIKVEVTLVAPKALERFTGKAKRVFDMRDK